MQVAACGSKDVERMPTEWTSAPAAMPPLFLVLTTQRAHQREEYRSTPSWQMPKQDLKAPEKYTWVDVRSRGVSKKKRENEGEVRGETPVLRKPTTYSLTPEKQTRRLWVAPALRENQAADGTRT